MIKSDLIADLGDHAAGFGEAGVESDVDRSAQMPGREVLDAARVDHPHTGLQRGADLLRSHLRNLAVLLEQRVGPLVHRSVDEKYAGAAG